MTLDEELNGPTGPTQMQIDGRFIRKLMLAIGECHYAVNRSSPGTATDKIREVITELKGDPEWQRHFKKMGSPASG
jgi:hypothetical protein